MGKTLPLIKQSFWGEPHVVGRGSLYLRVLPYFTTISYIELPKRKKQNSEVIDVFCLRSEGLGDTADTISTTKVLYIA